MTQCQAEGCTLAVPPARLMCRQHWRMVPRDMRRQLMAAFGFAPRRAEWAWPPVAREAIQAVAEAEGRR